MELKIAYLDLLELVLDIVKSLPVYTMELQKAVNKLEGL